MTDFIPFVAQTPKSPVTGSASEETLVVVRDRLPATFGANGGVKVEVIAGDIAGGTSQLREDFFTEPLPVTGVGVTPTRSMSGYNKATYQIDVPANVTSVTMRMEHNLTGNKFVNSSDTGQNTTLTEPDSYIFSFEGELLQVRMNVIAFTGAAEASITVHLLRRT